MSDNSGMWTAVTVCAVIYAYSMLKDDLKSVGDKGKEIIKDVADALNPTKDTNLAYRGAGAIFGEDAVIDKVGGGIDTFIKTHSLENAKQNVKKMTQGAKDAVNPTKDTNLAYRGAGAIFGKDAVIDKVGGGIARILGTDPLAKPKQKPPTAPKPNTPETPAKQFKGKWLKLVGGKWIGLTKSDKVFSVSGKYVVHHYLWKPS